MKMYSYPDKKIWPEIIKRPVADNSSLEKSVKKILQKVKEKGDKAVIKFTRQFDEVKLKNSTITSHEIMAAEVLLSDALKQAIQQAKINIERFHISQKEEVKKIETMPGVICWRQSVGIEKVGLYIPGGSAPLFSTVLMLAIPAQIAGSKEIILCTPPQMDGTINPAILYTANLCGITKIFKVGGVQAIAAMAYGTESIPKVFKIFGPGNQYVTLAKQLVQQEGLAIDMPAGPSEVLIIADEGAIPEYVAADLLSQAEHGADSQVMLVTYSLSLVDGVKNEIEKQLSTLSRKKIAIKALENSKIILVKDLEEAVSFSNLYAPEHLILSCYEAQQTAQKITAAGSVFIGNYSPESAGDYASGTNHTLPTNGYAAMYSGVSLDSFVKRITYQQLTKEGLQNIGNTVMTMATAEGLDAHSNAVAVRLKN
ncbi:MAG: histidinol dehydrogenase [Chitinophagaceae bacterium]|nr:histidinol dehydrogenase [Chitinophagaceae bacterium]MBK8301548.1 histidinol dehydrogenase [Chitinophagaceae bacterium]MBK9660091.1 histidinol dehydrogenase [Chitinophagaceae bacterium]MBK9939207.1 histidinol dehydrogenase [Chitinophagaceae bacterium]